MSEMWSMMIQADVQIVLGNLYSPETKSEVEQGLRPKKHKRVPVSRRAWERQITTADFAVPEKRLAICIDGATFHIGERIRRDRWIREKLRKGNSPWKVLELRVGDLKDISNAINNITLKP